MNNSYGPRCFGTYVRSEGKLNITGGCRDLVKAVTLNLMNVSATIPPCWGICRLLRAHVLCHSGSETCRDIIEGYKEDINFVFKRAIKVSRNIGDTKGILENDKNERALTPATKRGNGYRKIPFGMSSINSPSASYPSSPRPAPPPPRRIMGPPRGGRAGCSGP
ncbi:unnamed protein product [Lepeophtheirus salmonis]|uniref:(salmon louse) hypothetical protein n=1 Tax=Lepeophtheirus salmonis TaxID=72036 RepID=A0A7R8H9D3_LEPSM|nr:unnamed protein product [Lepeophtheirus salmonis]CAF2953253.1 unnamed protein product [Lepeophtheirus salmonis]